jgi:hypothetical protein
LTPRSTGMIERRVFIVPEKAANTKRRAPGSPDTRLSFPRLFG